MALLIFILVGAMLPVPFGYLRYWRRPARVTRSCGCVFCDIGLIADADGMHRDGSGTPAECHRP